MCYDCNRYFADSSPKLLTPSEFKSPGKVEPPNLLPTHPALLSPASITGAVSLDQQPPDSTASVDYPDAASVISSKQSLEFFSDAQGTLTEVTSNVEPLSVSSLQPDSDVSVEEELEGEEEGTMVSEKVAEHDQEEREAIEESAEPRATDEPVQTETTSEDLAPPPPPVLSDEEAELPNPEDTQKTFSNILEMLHVDKPAVHSAPKPSFEEFTELVSNPAKLQERERAVEAGIMAADAVNSPESAAALVEDTGEGKIAGTITTLTNSTPSFPDVVKPATFQEPLVGVMQKDFTETEQTEPTSDADTSTQWPDIGGATEVPAMSTKKVYPGVDTVAGASVMTGVDLTAGETLVAGGPPVAGRPLVVGETLVAGEILAGADVVPSATPDQIQVREAVYIADSEPPDIGLTMPSALTEEISNVGPDLLEQEGCVESNQETVEEGTVKVKSKPRRRSRKKKQSSDMVASVGVMEAPR